MSRFLTNTIDSTKTAFGEVQTAEPTPEVQLQFPYNIPTGLVKTFDVNLGTVTQSNNMANLQTGAATNSAAHLVSRRSLQYHPGQGAVVRFTAIFDTGAAAGSQQIVGIGAVGDGFFFGFNGADFGVFRVEAGKPEVQTLTVDNPVGGAGAGNITITLDGDAKTVAVANSDTVEEVAVKIGDTDFSSVGLGWSVATFGTEVEFIAIDTKTRNGSYSYGAGSTGSSGTFVETIAAVNAIENFTAQTAWNHDVFDGTGPSKDTLDVTKGNVYQIDYQWLGFGQIRFSIEDPESGHFFDCHIINYAQTATVPSIRNPNLPLHALAINTTNNTNLSMFIGSMGAFIQGRSSESKVSAITHGDAIEQVTVGATEIPLITIHNREVFNGFLNRTRLQPNTLSVSNATKDTLIRIRRNTTLTGNPSFVDTDTTQSIATVDRSASGLTGGELIYAEAVAPGTALILRRQDVDLILNPGESVTISAEGASASAIVSLGINWAELF